jgi:hypothetical protein
MFNFQAFDIIQKETFVRFIPKTVNHRDYILIKRGHPVSRLGRIGGEQLQYFGRSWTIVWNLHIPNHR